MSNSTPLTVIELSALLYKFYRMEHLEGSTWRKRFRATDNDLQALSKYSHHIRNMVLDAFSMHGDSALSITSKTLPNRPYANEYATAALHSIAKALEARDVKAIGYMHLEHAEKLLLHANHLHGGDDWYEVAAEIQGLTNELESKQQQIDSLSNSKKGLQAGSEKSKIAKALNKENKIKTLVKQLNKKMDDYLKEYEATYGKELNTFTPAAEFLILIWRDLKDDDDCFAGLTVEETKGLSGNIIKEAVARTYKFIS